SREQATGIEQVNQAVGQMDKVTQQNAANAEESAAASEELASQAVQLQSVVGDLIKLVGGASGEQPTAGLRFGGGSPVSRAQRTVYSEASGSTELRRAA
ncbi:MAG: hypothetical protein ACFCVE_07620, partial [Phycisphaerae bacterium]